MPGGKAGRESAPDGRYRIRLHRRRHSFKPVEIRLDDLSFGVGHLVKPRIQGRAHGLAHRRRTLPEVLRYRRRISFPCRQAVRLEGLAE